MKQYFLTLCTTNNVETIIINETQKKLVEYLYHNTDFMAEDLGKLEIVEFCNDYRDFS